MTFYEAGRFGGAAPSPRFDPLQYGWPPRSRRPVPDVLTLSLRLCVELLFRHLRRRGMAPERAWCEAWSLAAQYLSLTADEAAFALGLLHDAEPRFIERIPTRTP